MDVSMSPILAAVLGLLLQASLLLPYATQPSKDHHDNGNDCDPSRSNECEANVWLYFVRCVLPLYIRYCILYIIVNCISHSCYHVLCRVDVHCWASTGPPSFSPKSCIRSGTEVVLCWLIVSWSHAPNKWSPLPACLWAFAWKFDQKHLTSKNIPNPVWN